MGEVYYAPLRWQAAQQRQLLEPVRVSAPEAVMALPVSLAEGSVGQWLGCGSGFAAHGPALQRRWGAALVQAAPGQVLSADASLLVPEAASILRLAAAGLLVLAAMPAFGEMRANVQRFVAQNLLLPSFSQTVTGYIEEFVAAAEQLSAIGTLLFLATALTAMLTIDRTLNGIWRTQRPRPLAQRLALYWSLLTVGPVLLGATLGLQVRVAERLGDWGALVETIARALPTVLGVIAMTLVYRFAPNGHVRLAHALVGALVAACLLEALRRLFGIYIARFPSYTVVYGAFAALPLLLPTKTCWCKRAARPPLGTDRQVMEPLVECRPTISLLSPDSERRCIVDAVEDISS
jgi:YihY family inner membrane protein